MGAKLSKGFRNPVPCLCILGKNRVVPTGSRRASARPPLPGPPDPAVRLGWRSDLVLEDVESEDETGDSILPTPARLLPPVIPPPRVRTALCTMTLEEHEILATLPNVPIYDDYEKYSPEPVSMSIIILLFTNTVLVMSNNIIAGCFSFTAQDICTAFKAKQATQ